MRLITGSALVLLTGALCSYSQYQIGQVSFAAQTESRNHGIIITPELSDLVEEIMNNATIPGFSLGVIYSDKVEFGSWGRKTEDGTNMTTDTLFTLASVSKAFLSSSMGILMDDFAHGRNNTALPSTVSRFDWDTKVADLLPDEWKLMDEWASSKANIRDILSHHSGLHNHDISYTANDTAQDVVRNMRYLRPTCELRQHFHYNNQMYMLGAHLISTYAGMPYTEFVKARIWRPLNMSETTFYASEASKAGKLTQTWTKFGRRIPLWFPDEQIPITAGPGGVISNVIDMAKWVRMLLNNGVDPVTKATVVPELVLAEVTTAHTIVNPRAPSSELSISGYGMGWMRQSYRGHEFLYHGGGIPGISTGVIFLPSEELGIVMLANADEKHGPQLAVGFRIIENFLGMEQREAGPYISAIRSQSLPVAPQTPIKLRPQMLSLKRFEGTYINPGYPNITVCAPSSDSSECENVMNDFKLCDGVLRSSTLYARIDNVWISHARLHHKTGESFALLGTYLFPHGYGHDTSPFETWETGQFDVTAEFMVDEVDTRSENPRVLGLGIMDLSGELTERSWSGGSIEQRADVWFAKV